jgi:hypothetical protein
MNGSAPRPRDKAELVLEINVGGTVYTTVSWRRRRRRARAREREREREPSGAESGRLTDGL